MTQVLDISSFDWDDYLPKPGEFSSFTKIFSKNDSSACYNLAPSTPIFPRDIQKISNFCLDYLNISCHDAKNCIFYMLKNEQIFKIHLKNSCIDGKTTNLYFKIVSLFAYDPEYVKIKSFWEKKYLASLLKDTHIENSFQTIKL